MKKILFLILASSSLYAQNVNERKIIKEASDSRSIQVIKDKYIKYAAEQQKLIDDFASKNTNVDLFSLQRIIDGNPIFFGTDNFTSATTLRANSMYPSGTLGLNVTGSGVTAGVWDGGKVRDTHVEFSGRITLGDGTSTLSAHGTHVTGTIIAQGISNLRKGLAYQASAITHDWTGDVGEMFFFASNGGLVSNHSYGNIATTLQIPYFGNYNSQSIEVDDLMNLFPYYQVVKSAGNDRNNTAITQVAVDGGYDLLAGVSTAKNVLTVAAVESVSNYTGPESVVMSSFSNYGPTDDGRIKPDISAKGVEVSSTTSSSNTAYAVLSGTSMASPAITGLILLLQKHYNNLNATAYMKSASVRGLICHSSREAGLNVGPDYEFGWGLADGLNAARVISTKGTSSIFEERTLNNLSTYTTSFTINSAQDINVTIAWTDPSGIPNGNGVEDNRTPRLVNNLDLKITKDATTYYPWKLNPDVPTDAATNNADNNVDNIERVEIFNATPGTYTIEVTHKANLQGDLQDYTLIATGTTGLSLNNADFVADNNLFVYPNPANDVLQFSNPNNIEVSSISITDSIGKTVLTLNEAPNSNTINISNLQSGVYFVKFTTDNKSVVKKIIKN
ncbi:MAG: S8 family serine peptidase [Bacteroidota bacterium]